MTKNKKDYIEDALWDRKLRNERLRKHYPHREDKVNIDIDSLESAYEKIASNRWGEIRVFHSDIYYITHLVNYTFFTDKEDFLKPQEVNELLYEEGLLKWEEYVPPKYVSRMEKIRFKHVAATRPDYNQ